MASIDIGQPEQMPAPEPPPAGAVLWARRNLFSTPFSTVLTLAMVAIMIKASWAIAKFALVSTRQWRAPAQNSRLVMIQAYPQEEMWRIWLTVGVVLFLLGMSMAVMGERRFTSVQKLARAIMALGGMMALAFVGPAGDEPWGHGNLRFTFAAVGLVIALAAFAWMKSMGERAEAETVSTSRVLGVASLVAVALLWVMRAPVIGESAEGFIADDWQPIALKTTALPWTIVVLLAIGGYFLGRNMKENPKVRSALVTWWLLSVPVVVIAFIRKPDIDWAGAGVQIGIAVVYAVVGFFLLKWMGSPSTGEIGRLVASGLMLFALIMLFFSPTGDLTTDRYLKTLLLALAIFGLLSPTFGGTVANVRKFGKNWIIAALALGVTFVFATSPSGLPGTPDGMDFLGGFALTVTVAFFSIILSFPLGVLLALGRNSTLPLFRSISTAYIELVRSVPLITWLFAAINLGDFFLPESLTTIGPAIRAIAAMTLFSAAYFAENVRGGLQALPKGQYEAADALGMGVVQKTALITMPQALKAVIPALVGMVISLFKDTSLLAIIGLFDVLYILRNVVPNQGQFIGSFMENIVIAAVIYWPFAFMMSRASMRLEEKLGLGSR
jgi:His/Glu/Gln/Arg/opine family amino acid ABC transporter permease subunit